MNINTLKTFIYEKHCQNNSFIFDVNNLVGGFNFMISITGPNIEIDSSGGSCICFRQGDYLYKLCNKISNLSTYITLFKAIIPESVIIYEDDTCILYKQRVVDTIYSLDAVTTKTFYEILDIYRYVIKQGYKLVDSNYLNFGYNANSQLQLFDIHDFRDLNYDDSLNIIIFINMLNKIYSINYLGNIYTDSVDELIAFSKSHYDSVFVDLINMCASCDYSQIDSICDNIKTKLCTKIYRNYQFISIFDKNILLENHTMQKYNIAANLINTVGKSNISSVIDAGCSLGGIALKIAQVFPNIVSTCNNITTTELDTAKEIASLCNINNVTFTDANILNITDTYDIGLYYAVFHHILKHTDIKEIFNLIKKQVRKYVVIELPFKGDALLSLVCKDDYNGNYKALLSPETLMTYMTGYFKVMSFEKITYPNSPDLNRYYFVLQVI